MDNQTTVQKKIPRQPVVVVMGHIDHGKSTLLDYIRKTNVVDEEEGGITQHISAYEVEIKTGKEKNEKITFIDTPGHEAFSGTRKHGSQAADLAVIVISAEEGVKPQTIEALAWAKENKMPFLVALSKIDKPNVNLNKVKQELAEKGILLEGWGGNIPSVGVSSKTGEGVSELLEIIILQAELEELSYNPLNQASGFVIESEKSAKEGIGAMLIVKDGTVKKNTYLKAGGATTPIRVIRNFKNEEVAEMTAGRPVKITGWNNLPLPGSFFKAYESKSLIEPGAEKREDLERDLKEVKKESGEYFPVIIKADTLGSLEAVEQEIKKLCNERVAVKIIFSGVGPINENDVKTKMSSEKILLLGFNVKTDLSAKDIATRNNIEIRSFGIIYELIEHLEEKIKEAMPKEEVSQMTGKAKILKIFSKNKNKQIVGGHVEEGSLETGLPVKIIRREAEIGEGRIKELQSQKSKIGKVEEGMDFGALIESKIEIASGDKIFSHAKG